MSHVSTAAEVQAPPAPRRQWGELVLALGLVALGIVTILDGLGQPRSTSASGIGAGQFPIIVGIFTLVLAALLTIQVLRGRRGEAEAGEGDVDVTVVHAWQAVAVVAAVLWFIFTVEPLGYVVAAAVTFIAIAIAAGSRRWITTVAIGVLLSLGVFYLFTLALQIRLPAGILNGIL